MIEKEGEISRGRACQVPGVVLELQGESRCEKGQKNQKDIH